MSDLFTRSESDIAVQRVRKSDLPVLNEVQLVKRQFSDKKRSDLADKGLAMADGSYPIETAKDLGNAINDYNRTGGDPAVKAHIIQAAKKLGLSKSLPPAWQ